MNSVRDSPGITPKVTEPTDGSAFEGRHSEPRDPANRTTREGSVAVASSEQPADPGVVEGSEASTANEPVKPAVDDLSTADPDHVSFMHYASPSREGPARSRILSFAGVGAHPMSTSFKFPPSEGLTHRLPRRTEQNHDREEPLSHLQYPHYLTRHTTGRNAQFYGLSRAEREHLGGVEYRAIQLLAYVVPIYFVLWQLLGCVGLGAYMASNKTSMARENGIDPWYVEFFYRRG